MLSTYMRNGLTYFESLCINNPRLGTRLFRRHIWPGTSEHSPHSSTSTSILHMILVCTSTYIRSVFPGIIDRNKEGRYATTHFPSSLYR